MMRLHPPKKTLLTKLLVLNALITLCALMITSTCVLVSERANIDKNACTELESLGHVINMNAQAPLLFDDAKAGAEVLHTLDGLEDEVQGWVLRPDGSTLAGNVGINPTHLDQLEEGRAVVIEKRLHWLSSVKVDDEVIGRVLLTAGQSRFEEYWKTLIKYLLLALIASLAFSALVSRLLMRFAARPLTALTQGSRRIVDSGDYTTRVPRISNDELGDLTDDFNSMLRAVEARDRELTLVNGSLERKVMERTMDLSLEVEVRTRAEESMREAKEDAEQANRAKSEFLANMSHELRTPLHGILAYSQFGLRDAAPEPADIREYFEHIHEGGQVLLSLLNDLLDLAKLESGKMLFDFTEVSLLELLDSTIAEFESQASMNHATVALDMDFADRTAHLDPMRFQQLLRNLISNALKFSPENGVVTVRARADADAVRFEVLDDGVGVPEDELESIFDKFIQSSKTKSGAGGTGLGLAICREIAAAFQGTVTAANRPEGGAAFTVEMPLEVEAELTV